MKIKLMESKRLPFLHHHIKTISTDRSMMVMIKFQDTGLMVCYKAKHKFNTRMETISEEILKRGTRLKD